MNIAPRRDEPTMNRTPVFLFFLNVLIVASCGLIYELLAGTLASYVLGDSVTQFSFIIGTYLFALGVGAWLSQFVKQNVAGAFIEVELSVAMLGGGSAPLLFLSFTLGSWFAVVLYAIVFLIGVLVGLELPLLMRILKDQLDFGDLVSKALAFDYVGSLVAALLFPVLLVPRLGLVRTSLFFGLLNATVALWGTWLLRPLLPKRVTGLRIRAVISMGMLLGGILFADRLTALFEEGLFDGDIIHTQSTPYQRIVVVRGGGGFQLFLNGNMQFNSVDEYRYHESLVHPAMLSSEDHSKVLILGGGDGLALREVLRWNSVSRITLVDIDPAMTTMARTLPPLVRLNENALADPRVAVVNQDAMIWLENSTDMYDVCVIDFPDPTSYSLGKLYTRRFYRLLRRRLHSNSLVAIQCTSPLLARRSYWCVIQTMEAAGFKVLPYHAPLPSFGVWGFALAVPETFKLPDSALPDAKFVDRDTLLTLFKIPPDLARVPVEVNRLDNQALVRYYDQDWARWN